MDAHALPRRIANEIAGLIAAGRIGVDDHLNTQRLAEQFAVSRTPVREALARLERLGLVEQKANRGYFVKAGGKRPTDEPSPTDVPDAPPAYFSLAEDWVRDRIPAEVTEQLLRERYDLTKSQLAIVLNRGAAEGWIERKPGYGWRLLPVAKTPEAVEQIYRFRLIVEPAGLLEPTFRIDPAMLDHFTGTLTTMVEGAIDVWPAERLYLVGVRFHEELLRMSGNVFLHQSLRRANSLRRLFEYKMIIDRKRVYVETQEHLSLLEILKRGDRDEAHSYLRGHLSGALSRKRLSATTNF